MEAPQDGCAFSFLEFKLGANRLSIKFCIKKYNFFLKQMYASQQKKQPNLKIQVKIFLKCPLWSRAAKLENVGTKIFLQEVDQESCGWNSICQISLLTLWLVNRPCFLEKIAQILHKGIVFFPEKGQEIKPWFWHICIAQWLKVFCTTAYFFRFWPSSGGKRGIKVGPKVLTLSLSLFHK